MNDAELLELCEHPELKLELSATTSVVHIAFTVFGFKCLKCGKVWDIGNLAEAIQQRARLLREKQEAESALEDIARWADAYPLDIFPEPDFKKAHELLKAGGMTLDAISASNMRHVVEGVGKIARASLKEPKP